MAQHASIELSTATLTSPEVVLDSNVLSREPRSSREEFSLPPVDSGKSAWLFLVACWLVEALVWGFAFSFGVFQDYYSLNEPFVGSGSIASIGTTTIGVMYMGTPGVVTLCRLYPRVARWFNIIGLAITSLAMALSSFCTTVPQLIVTQGLVAGIGGCFAYTPCVLYIDEWFVRRKGMAYGIVWSAAGFGGGLLPLLVKALLQSFGFRTAVQIWAGVLFVSASPLAYFIRPRLPYSATTHVRPFDARYFTSRAFTLHQVANIIQALGYFIPGFYLPSYARSVYGASGYLPTLTVLLVNVSATVGSVIMGSLTDKLQSTTCILISTVGATIGVLLIWGLSTSLPFLYLFCVVHGLFAGCWTSMWPAIMREVSLSDFDPVMVFGWLCVGRGIGNVASGPISSSLMGGMPWKGHSVGGYGSGYGSLIVLTGLSAFLGGSSFIWKQMNLL
ncbi:major facilitator superfamily domain-containing protein [Hypoxylon sp. NC1633]|nr:major facilitator superfamily domain-containing protein [Hypoxylon sp. NC1633]